MAREIVVIGAGAIGRAFLPWVIDTDTHPLVFVDSSLQLVQRLKAAGCYRTYCVNENEIRERLVRFAGVYSPEEFSHERYPDLAACFFAVGPRNVGRAAALMCGSSARLVLCENDPKTVAVVQEVVEHSNVFFAIPDVISSNTAPPSLLRDDPLSVVTESGQLFIEDGMAGVVGNFQYLSARKLLGEQWPAKLYLHNTPHCIAAYLGALAKAAYIHEAMNVVRIESIVRGAMDEMLACLTRTNPQLGTFFESYAGKELRRFRSTQLHDPVARVAREPLRKLETDERLIGAAQMCFSQGIIPHNIIVGIVAAVLFDDRRDPDSHLAFLRNTLSPSFFRRYILKLRAGEPLDLYLATQVDRLMAELTSIGNF